MVECPHCDRRVADDNALRQHIKAKHSKVKLPPIRREPVVNEMVEDFRALADFNRLQRAKFGVPCPRCQTEQPRRQPTILLPGRRCRVHRPPYTDPRPELTQEDIDTL